MGKKTPKCFREKKAVGRVYMLFPMDRLCGFKDDYISLTGASGGLLSSAQELF
jgi:hypothetical protein